MNRPPLILAGYVYGPKFRNPLQKVTRGGYSQRSTAKKCNLSFVHVISILCAKIFNIADAPRPKERCCFPTKGKRPFSRSNHASTINAHREKVPGYPMGMCNSLIPSLPFSWIQLHLNRELFMQSADGASRFPRFKVIHKVIAKNGRSRIRKSLSVINAITNLV